MHSNTCGRPCHTRVSLVARLPNALGLAGIVATCLQARTSLSVVARLARLWLNSVRVAFVCTCTRLRHRTSCLGQLVKLAQQERAIGPYHVGCLWSLARISNCKLYLLTTSVPTRAPANWHQAEQDYCNGHLELEQMERGATLTGAIAEKHPSATAYCAHKSLYLQGLLLSPC